jgi:short subunit dehydrogenase-like uncharacterized protein
MRPVLAGRRDEPLAALGAELGTEYRAFSLDDPASLREGLKGQDLVLNCAGPFSRTCAPMLDACLETGVHYLDITGEIEVFEHCWRRDEQARRADLVVCPGTGFDVVPTDCLAATLVERLPAATHLTLAFEAGGGASHGTALTSIEALPRGGRIRQDGELVTVPLAWKSRSIPFAHATRSAVTIPWGDVFTAWVTTGIPNIEVYLSMSPAAVRRLRWLAYLQPLLRLGMVQRWMRRRVDRSVSGPDEARRRDSGVEVWGEVVSADGRREEGTLSGPNGYDLTVTASLGIIDRLSRDSVEGGYYTPALLMGADYAAGLPGVSVRLP